MGSRFPRGPSSKPEARYEEAAEFLGTVFGYLELARPGAADAQARLDRKNRVLAVLGATYAGAFDDARIAVGKQLANLETERAVEQNQVAAKVENRKLQAKTALTDIREKAVQQQETAQSTTEQLRDSQRALNLVQDELATLQNDRVQLGARIVMVQSQILQLQPDYFVWLVDKNFKLPSITTRYQLASLVSAFAALNRQAFFMDSKILGYKARIVELTGKGNNELESLAHSEAETMAMQKRAKSAAYQLKRQDKPVTARSGVLSEKMAAFSTYSPFPYSQERKRVLSWFAK
jgi:predicted  nucleic acid-binding Zn-ribbon protein